MIAQVHDAPCFHHEKKGTVAGALFACMVPEVRFELTRYRYRRILSPLRLPFRHSGK